VERTRLPRNGRELLIHLALPLTLRIAIWLSRPVSRRGSSRLSICHLYVFPSALSRPLSCPQGLRRWLHFPATSFPSRYFLCCNRINLLAPLCCYCSVTDCHDQLLDLIIPRWVDELSPVIPPLCGLLTHGTRFSRARPITKIKTLFCVEYSYRCIVDLRLARFTFNIAHVHDASKTPSKSIC
jgi:hypothetical protein